MSHHMSRREFQRLLAWGAIGSLIGRQATLADEVPYSLNYILGSCMYGKLPLSEIVPQVRRTGAATIDIWPAPHGNQREQIDAMGMDAFAALLEANQVELGIVTRYDLGPFGLVDEMEFVAQLGGSMVVTGSRGPKGLSGGDLKSAVHEFVELLQPHVERAEQLGVTFAIENHANSLIDSIDSLRYFADACPSRHHRIVLAPYHLPQDPELIGRLIEELGERMVHFYAWQHGRGAHELRPKEEELEQMPGRGALDFAPLLAALRKIEYRGWTEIFMHPVPRGIPILETADECTDEINRARDYLEKLLAHA